jgi:hypothetical protein
VNAYRLSTDRVLAGASGATWAALAGLVGLITISLFFWIGQPWGTINDAAYLVMFLSLGPVMLAHYELGGIVPLWPARLSLGGAVAAVVAWAVVQVAFIVGLVQFDYDRAATGAFALSSLLQAAIGLWIAGASLLAGRWLPSGVRILGMLAGSGTVVMAVGMLLGGLNHPLTLAGGVGYGLVLPVWAWLLGRVFAARAREARAADAAGTSN